MEKDAWDNLEMVSQFIQQSSSISITIIIYCMYADVQMNKNIGGFIDCRIFDQKGKEKKKKNRLVTQYQQSFSVLQIKVR